jgi:RimJ/RimL family protein N-acetyltransferase
MEKNPTNMEMRKMNHKLFEDELICLANIESDIAAEIESKWSHDTEYLRMLGAELSRPLSTAQLKKHYERIEKKAEESASLFYLTMRKPEDDRLVGFIRRELFDWNHQAASLQLGIRDAADRGQEYSTQALRLMLRYAFDELNLQRVTLDIFEYNPREIQSYEKVGFVVEGSERKTPTGMESTGTSYIRASCEKNGKHIDNLEIKQRFPGAGQGAYNDHHRFFR